MRNLQSSKLGVALKNFNVGAPFANLRLGKPLGAAAPNVGAPAPEVGAAGPEVGAPAGVIVQPAHTLE